MRTHIYICLYIYISTCLLLLFLFVLLYIHIHMYILNEFPCFLYHCNYCLVHSSYLLPNSRMAFIGLIPMLVNYLLTLAGKLPIFEGKNGESSGNVKENTDSSKTTAESLSEEGTNSLVTQVEMGVEVDISRSVDNPMKESLPPFTFSILPPELILMIIPDLPDSSQACLALVERYLYLVLMKRLKSESLQLPARRSPFCRDTVIDGFRKYRTERWIFLSLLQNDLFPRWGLCAHCFKLHPLHQFAQGEIGRIPHRSHCAVKMTRNMRNPWFAGSFHVCPCITLTRRGKLKLLEDLYTPASSNDRRNEEPVESNGPVIGLSPPRKGQRWWHVCRKRYGSIVVTTKVRTSVEPFVGIVFTTQYEFQSMLPLASSSECLCCQAGLHIWVHNFLRSRKKEYACTEFEFLCHMIA